MNRPALVAALLSSSLLLAACTPPTTPPPPVVTDPGTPTDPPPAPPVTTPPPTTPPTGPALGPGPALFIPQSGAAVGTGDGTIIGTVYVSPNVQEIEWMNLVNEVRTKGTAGGVDAVTGTCADGLAHVGPLTFSGPAAFAARKHALYMQQVGVEEGHQELQPDKLYFYGKTPTDRATRALREEGKVADGYIGAGENLKLSSITDHAASLRGWMRSEGHCKNFMDPRYKAMGVGYDWNESPPSGLTVKGVTVINFHW